MSEKYSLVKGTMTMETILQVIHFTLFGRLGIVKQGETNDGRNQLMVHNQKLEWVAFTTRANGYNTLAIKWSESYHRFGDTPCVKFSFHPNSRIKNARMWLSVILFVLALKVSG